MRYHPYKGIVLNLFKSYILYKLSFINALPPFNRILNCTSKHFQLLICRTKPEKEKKEYVIPLIKQNKWRREDILKKEKDRDQPLQGKDAEEDEALKEILEGTLFWLL